MKILSVLFVVLFLSGAAIPAISNAAEVAPITCTFTIKGTFNGTVVDVQISVSDVTLVECALLKAGVKKAIQ